MSHCLFIFMAICQTLDGSNLSALLYSVHVGTCKRLRSLYRYDMTCF